MTPEAQRIAIAEVCGWKACHKSVGGFDNGDGILDRYVIGIPPDCTLHKILPNYLNDLNAMHKALKFLDDEQQISFMMHLASIVSDFDVGKLTWRLVEKMLSATAAQLAEAFLRTLNLWTPRHQ